VSRSKRHALRRVFSLGRWILAVLTSHAGACKSSDTRAASWSSDGDALGQRVRRGELPGVSQLRFRSTVLGRDVAAVVATPPGYTHSSERRYPVVYIFPGIGGDEWTYLREVTLDNPAVRGLFANPETSPILVLANPADSAGDGQALAVLADELVREVDARFHTRTDRNGRALEGFSLGGVTALSLYLQRPDTFGHVAALSSACYLLSSCRALREKLSALAQRADGPRVLLAVGARESAQNRAVNDELAPLLGVTVSTLPDADHDWAALLRADVRGAAFGQHIAEFHLRAFGAAAAP
jgi:enterochelin esterase-like enzyme